MNQDIDPLEIAVVAELRKVSGNKDYEAADITEWSTGDLEALPDELVFYLPDLRITVGILKKVDTNSKNK